jgi:hypothetical protein
MIPFGDHIHFRLFINKGMTEGDVINLYGSPRYVYFFDSTGSLKLKDNKSGNVSILQKSATGNYRIYIKGYEESPYPISYKVIVYWGGFDAIAYVYINQAGKVEKTFIGGS